MPNLKKSFFGILMTCTFLLISACGEGSGAAGNSADPAQAASGGNGEKTGTQTSAKPVAIEFWYGLGGKLGENMQVLIDKFNSSQQEVIVKPVVQADYSETEKSCRRPSHRRPCPLRCCPPMWTGRAKGTTRRLMS